MKIELNNKTYDIGLIHRAEQYENSSISVGFVNSFKGNILDSIILEFRTPKGFESIGDARRKVEELGQNKKRFFYIKYLGHYYAVGCNSVKEVLIIAKEYMWFRDPQKYLKRYPFIDKKMAPYIIGPGITNYICESLAKELMLIDPHLTVESIKNTGKLTPLKLNALAMFGEALFCTKIPIFQMDVASHYFRYSTPKDLALWKEYISAYNPFSGDRTRSGETVLKMLKDTSPDVQARIKDWFKENRKRGS